MSQDQRGGCYLTVINTADGRPELPLLEVRKRISGLGSRVGTIPLALTIAVDNVELRMRGVLENVSFTGLLALLNLTDLLADADHGVGESVKLLLALTLSGLNHESAGDGPAHGGRVEAVILKTLGNIDDLNAGSLGQGAGVDDELVGAASLVVGVEDGVVVLETSEEVVGVQQSGLGGVSETLVTHAGHVHPADGQDAGAAKG